MSDTQKVRVTNWPFGSIWTIGFLFTMGYIPQEVSLSFWEVVGKVLFTYIIWPLLLGTELSGGVPF